MKWVLPYVDQPPEFWVAVASLLEGAPLMVYFPLPNSRFGTGRPPQPRSFLEAFLAQSFPAKCVLLNPVVHSEPADVVFPALRGQLERLHDAFGVAEAIVTDPLLGVRIRDCLPQYRLAASTLMDIASPNQLPMLRGVFDTITPSDRILRDLQALRELRRAFAGTLRLMVNEGCLPGCPFRVQHFFEMASGVRHPESLCAELIREEPWLGLIGAWVLPQHLHVFDGLYDEIKLAGRVTLRDPGKYLAVLSAYSRRSALSLHEIGGGPATALGDLPISESFYCETVGCSKRCGTCRRCSDYFTRATNRPKETRYEPRRSDEPPGRRERVEPVGRDA
jgi:hypothetical protein